MMSPAAMTCPEDISKSLMNLIQRATYFINPGSRLSQCSKFLIDNHHVGYLIPEVVEALKERNLVDLEISKDPLSNGTAVHFKSSYKTVAKRTEVFAEMLADWRSRNLFPGLLGWRDELYDVYVNGRQLRLMSYERAAAAIFGFTTYGVHVNGYVQHPEMGWCMWVGRRSHTKQTSPDMLDQIVAGGLTSGLGIRQCVAKECQEEASIPEHLVQRLKSVGTVTCFYEDERGICPQCEYVFDVKLPMDFTPQCSDGEMQEFLLLPYQQVLERVALGEFKLNCGLICLDFLIRHGFISPDTEPTYNQLVAGLHSKLPSD